MPFAALGVLRRRKRQVETLRIMLGGVNELLDLAEKIAGERELTSDELQEVDALQVRRDRIAKGLEETEQLLSATGV